MTAVTNSRIFFKDAIRSSDTC